MGLLLYRKDKLSFLSAAALRTRMMFWLWRHSCCSSLLWRENIELREESVDYRFLLSTRTSTLWPSDLRLHLLAWRSGPLSNHRDASRLWCSPDAEPIVVASIVKPFFSPWSTLLGQNEIIIIGVVKRLECIARCDNLAFVLHLFILTVVELWLGEAVPISKALIHVSFKFFIRSGTLVGQILIALMMVAGNWRLHGLHRFQPILILVSAILFLAYRWIVLWVKWHRFVQVSFTLVVLCKTACLLRVDRVCKREKLNLRAGSGLRSMAQIASVGIHILCLASATQQCMVCSRGCINVFDGVVSWK